jgi:hypothetical protein
LRIEKLGDDLYDIEHEPLRLKPFTGVHEVDYAGIGITMIDRSVFERVPYPWFRTVHKVVNNVEYTIGEDVYFYLKLREHGIKSYVTTDILALHIAELALDVNNIVRHISLSWRLQP